MPTTVYKPLRSDHRYIATVLKAHFKSRPKLSEAEMTVISDQFVSLGGSWKKIFLGGSMWDFQLLKDVIKSHYEKK